MKKLIQTGILALVAVVSLASNARAEAFPVGFVFWTPCPETDLCEGTFSISNQTGDNNQVAFPILDFVDFAGMTLTVDTTDVFTVPGDFVDQNFPEPGYNFDLLYLTPVSGVIGGGPAPVGPFDLDGGGQVLLSGNFYSDPVDLFNDPNFQAIIYVDGERVVVPEPITMSLLGLGLAGIAVRRRRAARK